MKKKSWLLVIVMMIAVLCMGLFAACGEEEKPDDNKEPDDTTETTAIYVGLFSYTKAEGGYVTSAYLNLKEDGTFYYKSEFLAKPDLGTYEYNADKTKITLNMTVDPNLSGTFDVEINDAGLVVIKNIGFFYYEGELLFDNFTYDSVSPKPVEQPIEIVSFYIQNDKDAKLTFFTGNKYELQVTTPEIVSSGTYTKTESGNNVSYTLTDTLGSNATYTYTYTYTEADGYTNCLLKGTGIDDAGIAFVYEVTKDVMATLAGTGTSTGGTETVSMVLYTDGTFLLTFTMYGSMENQVTGTYAVDYATMSLTFGDAFEGAAAVAVKSVTGILDAANGYAPSVTVELEVPQTDISYTATLTAQAA